MFEVVDGQQRLATLSMIFGSMRAHLSHFKQMHQPGMGAAVEEAVSELSEMLEIENNCPRVTLGESDSKLFKEIITSDDPNYADLCKKLRSRYQNGKKRIAESHLSLINNYRILCEKTGKWIQEFQLQEAIDQKDMAAFMLSLGKLKKCIKKMKDQNHFAFVEVRTRDAAYKIFNTFNSRGQHLTHVDLVKSHLLSNVEPDQGKKVIENRWRDIFDERLKDRDRFLYESLSSRHPTGNVDGVKITIDNIFRINEPRIKDLPSAEKYVEELNTDAKFIKQMDYPGDLPDEQQYDKIKSLLYGILLLNARYIRVPILAACRRWGGLENNDLRDLVDCLLTFFFKFKFINDGTAEDVRSIANAITKKIENGEKLPEIIYTVLVNEDVPGDPVKRIDDERFADNFAPKMFKLAKNTAKYILLSMEIHTRNEMGKECVYLNSRFELEHILPTHHQKHWDEKKFLGQNPESGDISKYKNRLGNLTLLSKKWNLNIGAKEFSVKRDNASGYAKSDFMINKKYLKDYNEWTAINLQHRENDLCEIASKVWSLDKHYAYLKHSGYKDPSQ